jgi:hypothetical protein
MFTPEVLLFSGSVVVVISAFLLAAAIHVRGWFFIPEPKVEVRRVVVHREQPRSTVR